MEWLIGIGRRNNFREARKQANNDSESRGDKPSSSSYLVDPSSFGLVNGITKEELQATVPAPTGVDLNEWLATNTLSFFKHITLVYESVNEHCTPQHCSANNAGVNGSNNGLMNYTWVDERGKKMRTSATQYIELVVVNVEKIVTDENTFPTKYDMHFPTTFVGTVKRVFRMLFHVLAHMYQAHYEHLARKQQTDLLNTVFMHFMYFQTEHALLEPKEIQPLEDLIKSLCL